MKELFLSFLIASFFTFGILRDSVACEIQRLPGMLFVAPCAKVAEDLYMEGYGYVLSLHIRSNQYGTPELYQLLRYTDEKKINEGVQYSSYSRDYEYFGNGSPLGFDRAFKRTMSVAKEHNGQNLSGTGILPKVLADERAREEKAKMEAERKEQERIRIEAERKKKLEERKLKFEAAKIKIIEENNIVKEKTLTNYKIGKQEEVVFAVKYPHMMPSNFLMNTARNKKWNYYNAEEKKIAKNIMAATNAILAQLFNTKSVKSKQIVLSGFEYCNKYIDWVASEVEGNVIALPVNGADNYFACKLWICGSVVHDKNNAEAYPVIVTCKLKSNRNIESVWLSIPGLLGDGEKSEIEKGIEAIYKEVL